MEDPGVGVGGVFKPLSCSCGGSQNGGGEGEMWLFSSKLRDESPRSKKWPVAEVGRLSPRVSWRYWRARETWDFLLPESASMMTEGPGLTSLFPGGNISSLGDRGQVVVLGVSGSLHRELGEKYMIGWENSSKVD